MSRDCNTCRKSKDQWFNSCGYLSIDKRRKRDIDFPAIKNPFITVSVCPVYFFNTYRYIYDWYNMINASRENISKLSLAKRIIFREFRNYLNVRREYIIAKERGKNGK